MRHYDSRAAGKKKKINKVLLEEITIYSSSRFAFSDKRNGRPLFVCIRVAHSDDLPLLSITGALIKLYNTEI